MMEAFLIPNNLDSHGFTSSMITTIQDLSEGSFAKRIDDLVTICKVIMMNHLIVSSVVIVPEIVSRIINSSEFLGTPGADTINRGIVQDFLAFIFG
jgi:hypothetical protein